MIDEMAIPAMSALSALTKSLVVRITTGEGLVQEEKQKRNPDVQLLDSCGKLLVALKALKVQTDTCIAVLDDQMDVIAQEGDVLVLAKHTDLKALEAIHAAASYVEMVMEKKPQVVIRPEKEQDWNTVFKPIYKV
jgi:hypothetical protein